MYIHTYIHSTDFTSVCVCVCYSVAVLRGHTLAVTSVDWRRHADRSLLASCSDDRVCYMHTNYIHPDSSQKMVIFGSLGTS